MGRTYLALERGPTERYAETLLAGCVENLQFDRQMETNRADYFMRLLDRAELVDQARNTVLVSLPRSEDGWDHDWMLDLLEEFAKRGDRLSFDALRDHAAKGDERAQNNLASTSDEGLAWVAENVLPHLATEDRWRVWMWLPDEESDDRTPLQRELRALDRRWDEERTAMWASQPKAAPVPPRDFLDALDGGGRGGSPRAFRETATAEERIDAAERLLQEMDRRKAFRLADALGNRPFPLSLPRLIREATHPDHGPAVCKLLAEIDTPQVRHLALRLLRVRPLPENAIELLKASFRPGDEALIRQVLGDVEDDDQEALHGVVLDLVALSFGHPNIDWQPHTEWAYEHSPCSFCRSSMLDWMAEHGHVPAAVFEEAPYDAEPKIRKIAESRRGRQDTSAQNR